MPSVQNRVLQIQKQEQNITRINTLKKKNIIKTFPTMSVIQRLIYLIEKTHLLDKDYQQEISELQTKETNETLTTDDYERLKLWKEYTDKIYNYLKSPKLNQSNASNPTSTASSRRPLVAYDPTAPVGGRRKTRKQSKRASKKTRKHRKHRKVTRRA